MEARGHTTLATGASRQGVSATGDDQGSSVVFHNSSSQGSDTDEKMPGTSTHDRRELWQTLAMGNRIAPTNLTNKETGPSPHEAEHIDLEVGQEENGWKVGVPKEESKKETPVFVSRMRMERGAEKHMIQEERASQAQNTATMHLLPQSSPELGSNEQTLKPSSSSKLKFETNEQKSAKNNKRSGEKGMEATVKENREEEKEKSRLVMGVSPPPARQEGCATASLSTVSTAPVIETCIAASFSQFSAEKETFTAASVTSRPVRTNKSRLTTDCLSLASLESLRPPILPRNPTELEQQEDLEKLVLSWIAEQSSPTNTAV